MDELRFKVGDKVRTFFHGDCRIVGTKYIAYNHKIAGEILPPTDDDYVLIPLEMENGEVPSFVYAKEYETESLI